MKAVILICDSFAQYKKYMMLLINSLSFPKNAVMPVSGNYEINDTRYLPLYYAEDIRKIMGLQREGIEIRIIGEKARVFYLMLKAYPKSFGLRPCKPKGCKLK